MVLGQGEYPWPLLDFYEFTGDGGEARREVGPHHADAGPHDTQEHGAPGDVAGRGQLLREDTKILDLTENGGRKTEGDGGGFHGGLQQRVFGL
jgi:hypothetical protein